VSEEGAAAMAIRVLVVDDEEDFLVPMVMRLKLRGLEAHGAGSGDEALEFLSEHEVDVVVLDVKMPGRGGLETLREIKLLSKPPEVIVLTGHGSEEFSRIGMELGAFDYLIKPVKLEDVIRRIEDAFQSDGA
jgi:DNA-binding response OmpR family regulator